MTIDFADKEVETIEETEVLLIRASNNILSYQYLLNGYSTNEVNGQVDQKIRKMGKNLAVNIMNLVNSDPERIFAEEIYRIYTESLQIITTIQSLPITIVTSYSLSVNSAQLDLNMCFYSFNKPNSEYILRAYELIYQDLPSYLVFNRSFTRFIGRVKQSLFDAILKSELNIHNEAVLKKLTKSAFLIEFQVYASSKVVV